MSYFLSPINNYISVIKLAQVSSTPNREIKIDTLHNLFFIFILPVCLGITTTIVVSLIKSFFYDTFLPRYRQMTHKGFIVSGKWETEFPSRANINNTCKEFISIRHVVDDVQGDIFYTEFSKADNSVIKKKHFEFKGTFVDSVLSATYWNTDRIDKGRGTFCLLSIDSNILSGRYSWLEPDIYEIVADEYIWRREN